MSIETAPQSVPERARHSHDDVRRAAVAGAIAVLFGAIAVLLDRVRASDEVVTPFYVAAAVQAALAAAATGTVGRRRLRPVDLALSYAGVPLAALAGVACVAVELDPWGGGHRAARLSTRPPRISASLSARVDVPEGTYIYAASRQSARAVSHLEGKDIVKFTGVCIGTAVGSPTNGVPDARWLILGQGRFAPAARFSGAPLTDAHPSTLCPGEAGTLHDRAVSRLVPVREAARRTWRVQSFAPRATLVGFALLRSPHGRWVALGLGEHSGGSWSVKYVKPLRGVVVAQACWALGVPAVAFPGVGSPVAKRLPGTRFSRPALGVPASAAAEAACSATTGDPAVVSRTPPPVIVKPNGLPAPSPEPQTVRQTTTTQPTTTVTEKRFKFGG